MGHKIDLINANIHKSCGIGPISQRGRMKMRNGTHGSVTPKLGGRNPIMKEYLELLTPWAKISKGRAH